MTSVAEASVGVVLPRLSWSGCGADSVIWGSLKALILSLGVPESMRYPKKVLLVSDPGDRLVRLRFQRAVSVVERTVLAVDRAVTVVDEALPGGAGGGEAKTPSLETSETGGRCTLF